MQTIMDSSIEIKNWPGTAELLKPAGAVAKVLQISPTTLRRLVKSGKIECIKPSKTSMFFTYDQVCQYIDKFRYKVHLNINI